MDEFEDRLKRLRLPAPSAGLDDRVLSLRYKLSPLAGLLPGETVLLHEALVWGLSVKSLPSYRVFVSVPPLCEAGLYVTDRRVLTVTHVFRLVTVELSQWFEGKADARRVDTVEEIRTGRNAFGARFLEIASQDPRRRWWRSSALRLRLFMRDPESAGHLILRAAEGAQLSSSEERRPEQ